MDGISIKLHFLPGLLIILFSSCSPIYYIPNTLNVPTIHAKGQTNLTVSFNNNQFEFQGAYGISKELALQANAGFMSPKDEEDGNGGSGKFIEGGLGFYKNIRPDFLFDVYGLIGGGTMENHFPTTVSSNPSTNGKISANIFRIGLQPSLSYHKKYFSISGAVRIVSLNYSAIKGRLIFDNEDQVKYLNDHKAHFLFEPGLTIRSGFEKFKFQIQLTKSFNLSNSDFKQDDDLLTIGLNFNF